MCVVNETGVCISIFFDWLFLHGSFCLDDFFFRQDDLILYKWGPGATDKVNDAQTT